ncbi:hypothetical protein [Pedobacter cryotolerans]|uniref:Uncharacterized protein n=1 Tax=Pedobacter cryotolerans TaxID=2571270 RepID=A0A4U1CBS1_9SPHI|nr:hypothetical protein [Pedobacter cryotolerans]TKC01230.1 hypothetical protein FA045_08270 [Pedobacter cryotolerans]
MSKLVTKLWSEGNIVKLREIRDSKCNLKLRIYHHSQGTDSYYCDLSSKYLTWAEVDDLAAKSLANGEKSMTIVIPYKAGIFFTRGVKKQMQLN